MRWLLVKDLQILKRSPLLVGVLIIYPIAIALMIGFALSSPPGKPKVAFYNEVPPGKGKISFGTQQINVANYASELLQTIQPIRVHSEAEAVAKVRSGEALAAVIIPAELPRQLSWRSASPARKPSSKSTSTALRPRGPKSRVQSFTYIPTNWSARAVSRPRP